MTGSTHRSRGWIAVLVALGCLTAACGNRVPQDRIEAASYLDGTRVVDSKGGQAVADAGSDQATPGDPSATASTTPGQTGGAGGSTAVTAPRSGSSATASGGGAATATGAPASKATGSEVAIGVLGTFTGPVGVYVQDFATAVQVWGRWVNDHGGLNGHRVKVVVADDGGSPAGFNSRAQQLVEQQHVLAFAFTTLGLAPQGNNAYLDAAKVPTFGTESGTNAPYNDPFVLTSVPSGDLYADAMMRGFANAAKSRGIKKLAILSCSDFSLCDNFDREWSSTAMQQATGLQVVYRGRPSLTTPDFTSICIDARNAGAEAILNGMDTASLNRLAESCNRQGYHPIIGLADLLARPELANNPVQEGSIVGTKQAPWFDTRAPGIAEMVDAFAKYAPGTVVNGTLAGGWTAARFLQAAAARLPGNPTSADFLAGLANLGGTTLGGITYPLTGYAAGKTSPKLLCYSAAVVKSGKFASAGGPPLTCS
jgi:branched-chain amino acid transport system substrate-binding protein